MSLVGENSHFRAASGAAKRGGRAAVVRDHTDEKSRDKFVKTRPNSLEGKEVNLQAEMIMEN